MHISNTPSQDILSQPSDKSDSGSQDGGSKIRPLCKLPADAALDCAEAVRHRRDTILARLMHQTRTLVLGMDALTDEAVLDELPQLIEEVALVIENQGVLPDQPAGESHANDRFDQDFQVDQLMHEYSLLRLILPEEIAEHLKRDLTPEEVRLVHLSIDSSVRHAVTEFGDNMNHRLHGEAEALAKYLAFLSHDLRGNLNGAMLMIEVLRRDMRKEGRFSDQVEDLEEMRMTMLGTVATMDRFLQAERLRQKAVEPSVSLVDVNLVISQTWTTTGRDHPERQLTLDLQIEPELSIVTDRELFVLIVHNLISNARRHAKSSVKVHMTAEPLPDDSDLQGASQWTLSVSDDGGGIEPAVRPHLFNAFGRGVHRSGTGLGLFIVKSAADILNAEIHVESDPGHGATFVVEKH